MNGKWSFRVLSPTASHLLHIALMEELVLLSLADSWRRRMRKTMPASRVIFTLSSILHVLLSYSVMSGFSQFLFSLKKTDVLLKQENLALVWKEEWQLSLLVLKWEDLKQALYSLLCLQLIEAHVVPNWWEDTLTLLVLGFALKPWTAFWLLTVRGPEVFQWERGEWKQWDFRLKKKTKLIGNN